MLTQKQQKLMISMIPKAISKNDTPLYKTTPFYRAMAYLKSNELVFTRENSSRNARLYELTSKGFLMARILCAFQEVKQDWREKYGYR